MKKQLFVLFGVSLLLVTEAAHAQSLAVRAKVPFDFIVGSATLAAGEYTIEPVRASEPGLLIRDADGRPKRLVMTRRCQSLDAADKTKLVFHRYGNRYFLAQVWVQGNTAGRELRQLPESPRETEMALDYPVRNVVVVAALR